MGQGDRPAEDLGIVGEQHRWSAVRAGPRRVEKRIALEIRRDRVVEDGVLLTVGSGDKCQEGIGAVADGRRSVGACAGVSDGSFDVFNRDRHRFQSAVRAPHRGCLLVSHEAEGFTERLDDPQRVCCQVDAALGRQRVVPPQGLSAHLGNLGLGTLESCGGRRHELGTSVYRCSRFDLRVAQCVLQRLDAGTELPRGDHPLVTTNIVASALSELAFQSSNLAARARLDLGEAADLVGALRQTALDLAQLCGELAPLLVELCDPR